MKKKKKIIFQPMDPNIQNFHLRVTQQFSFFGLIHRHLWLETATEGVWAPTEFVHSALPHETITPSVLGMLVTIT